MKKLCVCSNDLGDIVNELCFPSRIYEEKQSLVRGGKLKHRPIEVLKHGMSLYYSDLKKEHLLLIAMCFVHAPNSGEITTLSH